MGKRKKMEEEEDNNCIVVVVCSNFVGILVNQDEGNFVQIFLSFKRIVFSK